MTVRSVCMPATLFVMVGCVGASTALGADVLVTANANLSTLVTADNTVLRWTGNYTVTVDASYTGKTVAGVDAGSFTATIDFQAANRKVIMGNTAGTVLFQASGGDIQILGAGTGPRTAGFLVSPSLTGETIEIRATINDSVNANYWVIGNHTLQLAGNAPQVGSVDVGSDGGIARVDVDESGTIDLITPTGDFTIDVAAGKTISITQAFSVGANTLSVTGGDATSSITDVAQITLDNVNSVLEASGTITVNDLDLGANAKIALLDGASLTLTDAVSIGARTLTLSGTTGSNAETITATGGFLLDNASSLIKITGDSADALVVSKVDTGADLTVGKGIDADESVTITALGVAHNATLDVAAGKTLGGAVTLKAVKTLTVNNGGTISAITANTAAGTVNITGAATITTLVNDFAGTVVDVDASSTISTLTLNQNATLDVAATKTLTTTATVGAGRILTSIGTGTVGGVTLNGASAELNVTGGGTIATLTVKVDGGVLDVDTANCTVNACVMTAGSGDLTVENASRTIASSSGFAINNNTLKITQAAGTIALVKMDATGGVLDVDASTTITALSASQPVKVQAAASTVLTTTATVAGGGRMELNETGTVSAVTLNGTGAELNITAAGTVTGLTVSANGGVLDVDSTSTVTTVAMSAGAGDLSVDVASGKTLTSSIDVNNNQLTLAGTGVPGTILMDTDGGVLKADASSTPTGVTISGDVVVDVASGATLGGTLNIGTRTITLRGSGSVTRVDATTGKVIANGSSTIADLRAVPGSSGTFTYDGTGNSTVTSLSNSSLASFATFRKTGVGELTVTNGIGALFTSGTAARVAVDDGGLIVGTSGANHDLTFNDDGDEITVARGATLTSYGSIAVTQAGANPNIDAAAGSTVKLLSTSTTEKLTAAADNDFQLLGLVDIAGAGGAYTLQGAFVFQFGDVDISGTASLTNTAPSSTMEFAPGSLVDLKGSGSTGGGLTVDGQSPTTRIVLTTTTGSGTFTLDRNGSDNLTISNAAVSNATYRSNAGGAAIDELALLGTADVGDNVNWFTPAVVDDGTADPPVDMTDPVDVTDGATGGDAADTPVTMHTGELVRVGLGGTLNAGASSAVTGASGSVQVTDAISGSLVVTVADGNLHDDFAGIENETALPVTVRATSSLTGSFVAVIDLCYTPELLEAAGVAAAELVLYTYSETDGLWTPAGVAGRYQGDSKPTQRVGDFGYDSETMCLWVVRDTLSDFAAGLGSAELLASGGDATTSVGGGDGPAAPPLCGLLGMTPMGLTLLGMIGLRFRRPRHP